LPTARQRRTTRSRPATARARAERIRDVREGRDGALYLLTDEDNGRLLRLELLPPE
jgi:glucose/arabinose dehydrogenase